MMNFRKQKPGNVISIITTSARSSGHRQVISEIEHCGDVPRTYNLMTWSTSAMHTKCKCKAEGRRGLIAARHDEAGSRLEDDRWMWAMDPARGVSLTCDYSNYCLIMLGGSATAD